MLREAVCAGTACAFKLLCNRVGLPSIVVLGKIPAGRHAWNLVRVNGKLYHVDCTWDDPGSGGGAEHHGYFGVSDWGHGGRPHA